MKFSCTVGDLRDALNIVATTLDKRPDAETSKIYCEAKTEGSAHRVWLFTTDGIARCLMRIPAEVKEEGAWLLTSQNTQAMLAGFEDDQKIEFETRSAASETAAQNKRIYIKVGKVRSHLPAHAAIETLKMYVDMLPLDTKPALKIPVHIMNDLIVRTGCFVDRKSTIVESNTSFRNLRLKIIEGGYEATSTNSHVIAQAIFKDDSLSTALPMEILIPGKALPELTKIMQRSKLDKNTETVQIVFPEAFKNQIYFRFKDVIYGTSLMNTSFPKVEAAWQKIKLNATVLIDRQSMANNLVRCKSFCDDPFVKMVLAENGVSMKVAGNSGNMEEQLQVTVPESEKDKTSEMNVNIGHLSDVLSSNKEENLQFGFANNGAAALITVGSGDPGKAEYIVAGAK